MIFTAAAPLHPTWRGIHPLNLGNRATVRNDGRSFGISVLKIFEGLDSKDDSNRFENTRGFLLRREPIVNYTECFRSRFHLSLRG